MSQAGMRDAVSTRGKNILMNGKYEFRIKRHDPLSGKNRWDRFFVAAEPTERVLDGLVSIKDTIDGTLTFRRSCAHGICGSCAVMINGMNGLACQTLLRDLPEEIAIEPLPAFRVIKDLVVDMEPFFRLNDEVMPYLVNTGPPPERERLQSPAE